TQTTGPLEERAPPQPQGPPQSAGSHPIKEDTVKTPARTPEDIIGIIPHTLGYTPRRSLVAVVVGTENNGAQTSSTTMRIDFDRESAAQTLSEGGGWYADLIMRACTVTRVFLVLYDDDYQP